MDPVWTSKVVGCRDGSQFYDYDDINAVTIYMGTFKVGTELEHIIRAKTKKSSLPQNRYYYGVICKLLSDHTGHTVDEMDCILKWKFLKQKDAKGMEYVPSKMDLSTVEREEFHEQCRRWAAIVLEVNIPLPGVVEP